MDWPSPLKNKGVFFVKREKVPLPEQMSDLLSWMCCGDIHPNPLDQFCGIVEEVYNPTFSCYQNMIKFPHCVSDGRKYFMTWVSLDCVQTLGNRITSWPQQFTRSEVISREGLCCLSLSKEQPPSRTRRGRSGSQTGRRST